MHNCEISYLNIKESGSRFINRLIDISPKKFVKNMGVKFNLTKDGKAWIGIKDGTKYVIRNSNSSVIWVQLLMFTVRLVR